MVDAYRAELWTSWQAVKDPEIEEIPANKAELLIRIAPASDPFDGGRTATWLKEIQHRGVAVWRAVRDANTGHTIHCVSDRSTTLTRDLWLGLRLMAWMSHGPPLVWYWWDQQWMRVLPAGVEPGRDHVNGGWAVPGVREVHVYRREEAHKVLLHEMVHALEMDVPHASVEPVRRRFEAEFGRRLWPHFGEAYTELLAEWLWSIAGATSLAAAERRWRAQLTCSAKQAVDVWARIRRSRTDEDTNVFAYYVMKWVLMSEPEHLAVTLLSPTHAVGSWWMWWVDVRHLLEARASDAVEGVPLAMGMTCSGSGSGRSRTRRRGKPILGNIKGR